MHAELGGMYPVSGGTARFPHFAFGSVAGISFGFFSWIQAVTVAPIEVFAVMQYGSYYWHGLFNDATGEVTGVGFAMSILLMAVFTGINFLAMRLFNKVNSGITWWKVAIPVLTIIILLFHMHPSNFDSHGGLPLGTKAMFAAIPGAGIIFAYLGFEQADQLAGEIRTRRKNLPRAIITATWSDGDLRHAPDRVHRRAAAERPSLTTAAGPATGRPNNTGLHLRADRVLFGAVGPRLAGDHPADRPVRLPVRHRLDYQTFTSRASYGLARTATSRRSSPRSTRNGVPWVSLIFAFFSAWCSCCRSQLAAPWWACHLGQRAHVRRGPVVPGRVPGAGARGGRARTGASASMSPLAFVITGLIIYCSSFESLEAWHRLVIGCISIGVSDGFRQGAAAAGLEVGSSGCRSTWSAWASSPGRAS